MKECRQLEYIESRILQFIKIDTPARDLKRLPSINTYFPCKSLTKLGVDHNSLILIIFSSNLRDYNGLGLLPPLYLFQSLKKGDNSCNKIISCSLLCII